jgi:hypothetical protein
MGISLVPNMARGLLSTGLDVISAKFLMRPFSAALVICLCTALAACHKPHRAKPAHAAPPPPPPLPVVKAEEVSPPPQASFVLEKGMVIGKVAEEAYGHSKFSGMVLKFNKIADPTKIKAGAVINTPSIPDIFKAEGLDPKYDPAINVLAKAAHDFFVLRPAYVEARKQAMSLDPNSKKMKIALPADMKEKLEHIADALVSAAAVFAGAVEPHRPPNATVQQFREAALKIRSMAAGEIVSAEFDDDTVGQHLGLGMTNALIWVQQKYQ